MSPLMWALGTELNSFARAVSTQLLSQPQPPSLIFFKLAYFSVLLSCETLLNSLDTNHLSMTGGFDKSSKNKLSSGRGWNSKNPYSSRQGDRNLPRAVP